jgi:hypothetical protein
MKSYFVGEKRDKMQSNAELRKSCKFWLYSTDSQKGMKYLTVNELYDSKIT